MSLFKKELSKGEKFRKEFKQFLEKHLDDCADTKEVDYILGTIASATIALKKKRDSGTASNVEKLESLLRKK